MFSFQAVRFSKNTVEVIKEEISKNTYFYDNETSVTNKLEFEREIILKNVNYKYDKNFILKNLNLNIKKNSFVGIKGESGSGKSTLIDLLMCLIEKDSGSFTMNNVDVTKSVKSWQKMWLCCTKYFSYK